MESQHQDFTVPEYMQKLLAASGQGMTALAQALADILSRPVLISTSGYELVGASFSQVELDSFYIKTAGPKGDHESIFRAGFTAGTFQAEVAGRAIAPAGRVIGYLFIFLKGSEDDIQDYRLVIQTAAALCVVHLQNREELKKEQHKFKEAFLYDILYGNLKREEEIITTGAAWGWNFTLPHTVLLLVIPELDMHSPDQHLLDILARIMEKALIDKYHQKLATMVRYNQLVVLLPTESRKPAQQKQEILALMEGFLSRLAVTELDKRVDCGVGQTYDKAVELYRSYQEAKVSLELGSLLGIAVPFFSDVGVERIFYKHDLEDLKEYYTHVLGELHKQDDEGLALISVLESFAENQFEVTKTAEALFLHRNTLRYRLNKIENILGRSLNDNHTRFDIMAALKIKRLHRMDQEIG